MKSIIYPKVKGGYLSLKAQRCRADRKSPQNFR